MTGTRVYERVVIPDRVGDFTVMPASFSFFDPMADTYRTITTEPISVKVIPAPTPDPAGPTPAPTPTPIGAIAAVNTPEPADQPDDPGRWIIGPTPRSGVVIPAMIIFSLICVALPAAALLGAGGVWLWQRQQQPAESPPVREKIVAPEEPLRQPVQRTHPTLAAALRQNERDNYKAVNLALNSYLTDMLQSPVNGLTRAELVERLQEHGLERGLIQRIEDCLTRSEVGRYGPGTEDAGWSLLTATDDLLFELDKWFRSEA